MLVHIVGDEMLLPAAVNQLFLVIEPKLVFGLSRVVAFANCPASKITVQ